LWATIDVVRLVGLAFVLVIFALPAQAGQQDLGRGEKMRVLVDNIIVRATDHTTAVREAAAAKFNVYCQMTSRTDLDEVARVADLAEKHGIYHMVWMGGYKSASGAPERVHYVWPNGYVSNMCSPNSDQHWDWFTKHILDYAKISAEHPHLIGVFLDYEVYQRPKFGDAFSLSYDQEIMEKFADSQQIQLPDLKPTERKTWLQEQNIYDKFEVFQVDHWREKCRQLRLQVDEINPNFQFCLYPIPGSKFEQDACYQEWSTQQAPVIFGDAGSYGARANFESFQYALQSRKQQLEEKMRWARGLGVPFVFLNGLYAGGGRGDPEHFGKSAAMISQVMDGYWVFYAGNYPRYDGEHKEYFRWFRRGNRATMQEHWAFWQEPRQTPVEYTRQPRDPDRPQFAEAGVPGNIHDLLAKEAKFEILRMWERYQLDARYLENFDVVALQSFNGGPNDPETITNQLRWYVAKGGSLLLCHDLSWFPESPFPEIAQQVTADGKPTLKGKLEVVSQHEALGNLTPNTIFQPLFPEHHIFQTGPDGSVLIRDRQDNPVYVVGKYGEGRVIFSGCFYPSPNHLNRYYGKPLSEVGDPRLAKWQSRRLYPECPERELIVAIAKWLASAP